MTKPILVYTATRSGTWFLVDLLRTTAKRASALHGTGDITLDTEEIKGPVTAEWLEQKLIKFAPEEERNHDIAICRTHRDCQMYKESPLLYSLRNYEPEIKVISSMRDPLISLITNIARLLGGLDNYLEDKNMRAEMIYNVLQNRIDIISIPDRHRFLLPVDLDYTEKERVEKGLNLCKWCELPTTTKTLNFLKIWQPSNSMKKVAAEGKDKILKDITTFDAIKNLYYERNLIEIKKILGLEIEYLQQQEKAKKEFERIGYRDLLWW